jgi:hypothetical protein
MSVFISYITEPLLVEQEPDQRPDRVYAKGTVALVEHAAGSAIPVSRGTLHYVDCEGVLLFDGHTFTYFPNSSSSRPFSSFSYLESKGHPWLCCGQSQTVQRLFLNQTLSSLVQQSVCQMVLHQYQRHLRASFAVLDPSPLERPRSPW